MRTGRSVLLKEAQTGQNHDEFAYNVAVRRISHSEWALDEPRKKSNAEKGQ